MNPFRIFGLGTIVVDHQVILDRLPEADAKGEVIDDRYQVGGPVPTALCLLRKFGCEATFQGKWAKDKFGEMIESDLANEGINFSTPSRQADSKTGFAHVWVEQGTGRRSIAGYRGSHQIEEREVKANLLAGHQALHLDGWSTDAAIKAARHMRAQNGVVFMDLGSPKPHLSKLLAHVDSVNCPINLFHRLYETDDPERGAKELMKHGPMQVTVTEGENGAWIFQSGHPGIHQPAFQIEALDTNGAGDTFTGAMIYATMQGWPAKDRIQFANGAAALKCTKMGNRDALPSLEAVERFMNS
ncbi:MAG: carbohydrate kinase family protein [Limisphaerales bacterium]